MLLGFGPQLWKETEAPHTRCGGSSSQAQKSLLGGSKPQRRWSELSGRLVSRGRAGRCVAPLH